MVYSASHKTQGQKALPSALAPAHVEKSPLLAESASAETSWAHELIPPRQEPQHIYDRKLRDSDLEALCSLLSRIRIPWRYFLAESLFLQISIPEIAATVSNSRKYATSPWERFEATRHFFKTVLLNGPDSPEGDAIIARVNQVHRDMGIDPKSAAFGFVLYTLSHGFIDSIRRNSAYRPSPEEELALYRLMCRVGEKMGSDPFPLAYSDFIEANEHFKSNSWAIASETSAEVARSLLDNALARIPGFVRPLVRGAILSLVSAEVLNHLKLYRPPSLVRAAVRALFWSIA